jgi:hypothetical protein
MVLCVRQQPVSIAYRPNTSQLLAPEALNLAVSGLRALCEIKVLCVRQLLVSIACSPITSQLLAPETLNLAVSGHRALCELMVLCVRQQPVSIAYRPNTSQLLAPEALFQHLTATYTGNSLSASLGRTSAVTRHSERESGRGS